MKLFFIVLFSFSTYAQDFYSQVEEYLYQKFNDFDKIEFTIMNDLKNYEYIIDFSRELIVKGASAYLPVKLVAGNKSSNSILTLHLKLYKKVAVALREFNRKEVIDSSGINFQTVDITSLRVPIADIDFNNGRLRAKTNIKEGQVITKDLVEQVPLIQSGEKLTAECIKGSVVISTEAFARQDGRANEVIDILTVSNELLKAKVIGPQKVLIE